MKKILFGAVGAVGLSLVAANAMAAHGKGGGHFDKEVASDGNIRIEGEAAELTSMYAEAAPLCSGEAYITGGNAGFREASVTFRFYIQEAGDYFIWARVNPMGNYQQNSWYHASQI